MTENATKQNKQTHKMLKQQNSPSPQYHHPVSAIHSNNNSPFIHSLACAHTLTQAQPQPHISLQHNTNSTSVPDVVCAMFNIIPVLQFFW